MPTKYCCIILLLLSCKNYKGIQENIILSNPIFYSDSLAEYSKYMLKINYYKGYLFYEIPKVNTKSLNGDFISSDTSYYLVFMKANAVNGFVMDSLSGDVIDLQNISSYLKSRIVQVSNDTILKYLGDGYKKELKGANCEYHFAYLYPGFDSISFRIEKDSKIEYSFSKELDKKFEGKITNLSFLSTQQKGDNASYLNKFRVISFEITQGEIQNQRQKIEVFEKIIKKHFN
jgi:hypothetical protein